MDLRRLKYFIALAEELHFGNAARKLRMSQPPLSRQIRRLEEEVGTPLVARTKREVRLTPAGRSFLSHARIILAQVRDSVEEARGVGRGDLGLVRLSFVPAAGLRVVPAILRAFRAKHPRVDIRLVPATAPAYWEAIRASDVDFAIGALPADADDLAQDPLTREYESIALPEDHALAKRKAVPLKALDGVPFVFFPRHVAPSFYDHILGFFREAGATMNIVMEAPSATSMLAAVAGGIGATILPDCMRDATPKGVVFRRVAGRRPSFEWALMYRRGVKTGVEAAFLRIVHELYPGLPRA